jgi:valyl-tRNA synthetase
MAACDAAYDGLRFDLAAQALYEFIWGEFCDWYLEIAKHRLDRPETRATLYHCLDKALRLLHPLMPHITEEIWTYLKAISQEALIVAMWPEAGERDEAAEQEIALLMELIRGIRNARATQQVAAGQSIPATITTDDNDKIALLADNLDWLAPLARLDANQLTIQQTSKPANQQTHPTTTVTAGSFTCYLPMMDRTAERERMEKELERLTERIARSKALLAGEFSQRAPAEVVARERAKLADLSRQRAEIQARLAHS